MTAHDDQSDELALVIKLRFCIHHVNIVYSALMSWEKKYDTIFNYHKGTIRPLLDEMGLELSYSTKPNGNSYEEDVTAYVNALRDLWI